MALSRRDMLLTFFGFFVRSMLVATRAVLTKFDFFWVWTRFFMRPIIATFTLDTL